MPRRSAVVAVVVLLASAGARAEMDSFLLGNGADGALLVPPGTSVVINSYARVTAAANAGASTVSVSTTAGFAANHLVMVLQTTGLSPPPGTNGGSPIVITTQHVGQYELARIQSVGVSQLTFTRPLWQSYDANVTQVISVPEYTTVTLQYDGVSAYGEIYGAAWDGATGGVVAFLATGAVTNDGWIGSWDGFQGGPQGGGNTGYGCSNIDDPSGAWKGEGVVAGQYGTARGYGYLANGGGGGICHNSGGGGGGLGGAGGKGGRPCSSSAACDDSAGDYGGRGGAQISFDPRTRLFLGGGGGGGEQNDNVGTEGGLGGGIVFIRAASMARTNATYSAGVDASGSNAANAGIDAAGGGGAGGTVSVRVTGTLDCDWIGADGANGGSIAENHHGPGGGGAGGVVLVQSAGAASCWFGANQGVHGLTPSPSATWGDGFDAQDGSPGSVTTLTTAYSKPSAPAITSPVSATNNTQPTISGTVGSASTPIQLFVDGVPAGRTTSSAGAPSSWSLQVPSVLSAGSHTIAAQSDVDGAASDPASVSLYVTVNASITSNPASVTSSTSATFQFTTSPSQPTFTFVCKLDAAGSYTACSTGVSYSGLANGSHTFRVHTVDPQGFSGPDATWTWTVDTVNPTVSITSGPANPTNLTSATFAFTVTDATSTTTQCALDGGAYSACTSPKSYAGPLAQGSHTFYVRATDGAGNVGTTSSTWTIDTTAPTVTITSGPANPTNQTSATFQFSSVDAVAFECKLDAGAYASCTSPKSYSGLAQGSHTFTVRGRDAAGNWSTGTSATWTVDLTAPVVTITGGPSNPTNQTSASFTFTVDDAGANVQCSLDGSAYSACSSPKAYSGLAQGSHTFNIQATDTAGNVGPASRTWTIDTTAPVVSITAGPSNPTSLTSASFTFNVNDATATVQCKLDAGSFSACSSPKAYSGLAQGSHTFTVQATDPAGNVGSNLWTWTIDTTAPTVTIDSGPPARTNSTSATFGFTVTGATTIECRLDTGSWAACTSPYTVVLTAAQEGAHTFYVRGTDGAGNSSTANRAWTLDLTPPTTSFSATPPSVTNSTSAGFTFSATETSTFECSLDNGAYAACTSPTSSFVGAGSHVYAVRATDQAGNVGVEATFRWDVDLTPPETWLVSGPPPTVGMGDVTITVASNESGSTFQCSFDSGIYSTCSATYVVTSPAQGTHIVQIIATDPAGNPDPTPVVVGFAVDFDRDRDGLTDDVEATLGTDPARADTDGDGLADGTEVNTTLTSPLDDDSDDDGLLDGTEVNMEGTSPLNPDTDGDGLSDGRECGLSAPQGVGTAGVFVADADPATRTNPLKADTDDDGIPDGLEDADGNGRVDPGETDPAKADTDGDGLPDGLERITAFNPTDPCNPDTDGDGLQDGVEDANHNGMVDANETDPNKADTDHGGVSDGLEVQGHTSPLDPSDDYQVRGGGCSASGGAVAPLALLALVGLALRRRGRAG